jgi:hypothetical protein
VWEGRLSVGRGPVGEGAVWRWWVLHDRELVKDGGALRQEYWDKGRSSQPQEQRRIRAAARSAGRKLMGLQSRARAMRGQGGRS